MIPIELRLKGVRAFGNHAVVLGGPEVREVIMFGPNGSGKSTIARMIQALVGDPPEDLYQGYLDERDTRVNRRASAELTILNPKGEMWNPDWPETVVLGLEFGYENNRPFSRYYTVADGRRQNYRTHEEYAEIFRRTYNIKPDDRFMFIQQGESAALVQMKPRSRYETMKQFLGLEDLERRWQETLDARNRAFEELRNAQNQRDILQEGLRRKEMAWRRLLEYRQCSRELAEIQRAVAQDDLVRHVIALDRAAADEKGLAETLAQEMARRASLENDIRTHEADIVRLKSESARVEASLEQSRELHRAANEERQRWRREVDELARQVESIERILAEGLSGEELEARIAELEKNIADLDRAIASARQRETAMEDGLRSRQVEAASLRSEIELMKKDQARAERTLVECGDPSRLEAALSEADARLEDARRAAARAAENERLARERLELLERNRTATPPAALAASARYREAGVAAAVLCECVTPPEDTRIEDRRAIEGALGDLRWAVLVEDGRVLVDYSEYTVADFPGPSADGLEERRTALDCVRLIGDVPPVLSDLLSRVLGSVVMALDHDDAIRLAARGLVAYTPDGYRYDRFGRRYSVPSEMCLGQRAYEMALEKARESLRVAVGDSGEKEAEAARLDDEVRRLDSALNAARGAVDSLARLRTALPETEARLQAVSAEVENLTAQLRATRQHITDSEVSRAVALKDLDAVKQSYERWKRSNELPALKQHLSEAREAEGRARRAAEAALEEARRLEEAIDNAAREIDRLDRSLELGRARLGDTLDRLGDLEGRLSEKRMSLRDLQARSAALIDAWRLAFERPEVSDEEAVAQARAAAAAAPPASEEQRASWHRRQADLAPMVESLKTDLVPTAEEDYESAREQFDKAQAELERVRAAYEDAASKESAAQENFKKVMLDTFHRISSRFSRYMEKFGWTGFLRVEPVQGTQFELHIYVSVYQGVEPRPLLRNRSGGETSAIAALLTLAMVKEYRRPFYVFDEIDQSLDPANVLKIASLLREELDRKYIIISHRLNKAHLEMGQFGIGVYRSQEEGSRTRIYRKKEWPAASD